MTCKSYLAFASLTVLRFESPLPPTLEIVVFLNFKSRSVDIAHFHVLDAGELRLDLGFVWDGHLAGRGSSGRRCKAHLGNAIKCTMQADCVWGRR